MILDLIQGTPLQIKEVKEMSSYIGEYRYIEILSFIRHSLHLKKEKIYAYYLTKLSKYDFKLEQTLFSCIQFVESYLRATLTSMCTHQLIDKENFIHVLTKDLGVEVPSSLKYNPSIKDTNAFFIEADFDNLSRCFVLLPESKIKREIKIFGSREQLKTVLNQIRILRNEIAHGQSILRFINRDKIDFKIFLKPLIINILKIIPDPRMVENKINDLHNLYLKYSNDFEKYRLEQKDGNFYNEKNLGLINISPIDIR